MQNEVLLQDEILMRDEKKVRKHWLISFSTISILSLLSLVSDFVIKLIGKSSIFLLLNISLLLISLFFIWLLYHCAYKKRGTLLLSISIVIDMLLIIVLFWLIMVCDWKLLFHGIKNFLILMFYSTMYFFVMSYKLYKINKAWQKKERLEREKQDKDFLNVP